jgi:hypothetical protein
MNQSSPNPRKNRALNTMQAKGFALCGLGLGLLVIPVFAGNSPLLAAYAVALRPAGWFAWAAGVVLVAIHYVTRAKLARLAKAQRPMAPTATEAFEASAPAGPATLGQIRDELKKKADAARPTQSSGSGTH